MFNNFSMTGVGAIITVTEGLLKMFGVEIPDGSVSAGVNGLVSFVGLVFLVWGQVRRKDLNLGIIRK